MSAIDGAGAGVDDLAGQVERATERRGVGDDQHGVGADAGAPEHGVDGDLFVLRPRAEAVGAGQVDQVDRADAVELDHLGRARDGHAGVVADLDVGAGERVEERGLARVGIAGDQDHRPRGGRHPGAFGLGRGDRAERGRHEAGSSISMESASERRIDRA